jgi:cobalt/nickel transport system ATP-binding protein
MVSLAGVMVLEPELLLLDEPTAYLDQLHTQQLLAVLKKIHAQKTTILMATHDLNLVYSWADWVFVLDQGKLILEGTPQEVFSQPQVLQELQLGIPIALEMLSEVASALQATSPLMASQGSPPVWRQLHQRVLDLFRYF